MSFKYSKCSIPTVWCGNGKMPKKTKTASSYYSKKGTRAECLKKGFGAGAASERLKTLSKHSLQRIKYVGPTYEERFQEHTITNTKAIIAFGKAHTTQQLSDLLHEIFLKSNGVIDKKAFNSTLMYLYDNGVSRSRLCPCKKISE